MPVTVPPGGHIKGLQTGLAIDGDVNGRCENVRIAQPTTNFRRTDKTILVVFTALADGNPNAEAWATLLFDSTPPQILYLSLPAIIRCPGTAVYPSALDISNIPPGQYSVGIFYSENFLMPPQPEVAIPVTISP